MAPNSVTADALATALCVAEPERVDVPIGVSFRYEERPNDQGNGAARRVLKDWPDSKIDAGAGNLRASPFEMLNLKIRSL